MHSGGRTGGGSGVHVGVSWTKGQSTEQWVRQKMCCESLAAVYECVIMCVCSDRPATIHAGDCADGAGGQRQSAALAVSPAGG